MQGCKKNRHYNVAFLLERKEKLKQVQISEELFFMLVKYHLLEVDDFLPEIKKGLKEKLEALGLGFNKD